MRFPESGERALHAFSSVLGSFRHRVESTAPHRVERPKKDLERLLEQTHRIDEAIHPLRTSLDLVRHTPIDIVDFESRIASQAAKLASELSALDKLVFRQSFIRRELETVLVPLEEAAQDVAGALFSSGTRGLGSVNNAIWEFTRKLRKEFEIAFTKGIRDGKLTPSEQRRTTEGFARLEELFEEADELLNVLATNGVQGRTEITSRLSEAHQSVEDAEALAGVFKEQQSFRLFKGILDQTSNVARRVDRALRKLEIPLFPRHAELFELEPALSAKDYSELPGVSTFAMLNIAWSMRSIGRNGVNLLDPSFDVQVFRVFPDRIYFDAHASLEAFLRELEDEDRFEEAPAGLHRFRFRSVKQKDFDVGNLQLSYTRPHGGRFKVDADIDLYRNPLLHLFGEVFVNHLTGSKTDQFKVFDILRKRNDGTPLPFDVLKS